MEVSRTESQDLIAGNYIVFNDDVVIAPSRCMYYNKSTGITTLSGKTCNGNCYAVFKITFTGNISSTTANTVSTLAITIDGVPISKSEMSVVSTAENDVYNVSRVMFVKVPKGTSSTVGVQSQTASTVYNSILIIERVS